MTWQKKVLELGSFNYGRFDTVFSVEERSYKVVEFNTRRPQMYEDVDWFAEYSHQESICTKSIVQSIKDSYTFRNSGKVPERVIYINNSEKNEIPWSFKNRLSEAYPSSDIVYIDCRSMVTFYNKLNLQGETLLYDGAVIDHIIIQFLCGGNAQFYKQGMIINNNIRKAYNRGTIEISSPPVSLVTGSKYLFALLCAKGFLSSVGYSDSDIDLLREYIPYSIDISNHDSNLNYDYTNLYIRSPKVLGDEVFFGARILVKS